MRSVVVSCLLGSLLVADAADAATYYVRSDGNDSADGLSHATAWATLTKVNKQVFATSDVVLFREGDRYSGTLTVDWGGTASAPAVVGAYYLKDGVATRGYATTRPVIDGGNTAASGPYDALLRVRANRVRVENIKVINSNGRNIDVADSDSTAVVGCSTDGAYGSGIHFLRSTNPLVEGNYVAHAGNAFKVGKAWGGAVEMDGTSGAVLRNNIVFEVYGEGLNSNASSGTTIEGNYVYGARAVGIYADSSPDATIRRNIVVGTANSEYWRSSSSVGVGIALNNEKYHYEAATNALLSTVQTQRAKVYGNLVAFASAGIALWGEYALTSFDGLLIFNNTLVDNNTQFSVLSNPKPGSRFVNNIMLSLSSGTRDVGGTTDLGGMIAKNNYFSQGSPGGGYVNAGNRFTGLVLAKMSGWRLVSSREEITWRDFDLKDGSPAIGGGDDEPRSMATSADTFQLDYNRYDHNEPMDMGALRFTSLPKQPSAPQNLALN